VRLLSAFVLRVRVGNPPRAYLHPPPCAPRPILTVVVVLLCLARQRA
jgi:hypothetical protein